MSMRVLAGDIGGTKVLLQLAEFRSNDCYVLAEERFESAAFSGLLPLIREFFRLTGSINVDAACFGIAGPIAKKADGQIARVTNLPWVVDGVEIARELQIAHVRLINDFQAVGYGIEALASTDFVSLQEGERERRAPCAVVGAGTGLGQALLVWNSDHYETVATEGGHVDFAPTDSLQSDLLSYLRERYGRVSYERILSGPGIVNLYSFLCARRLGGSQGFLGAEDAAAITAAGLNESDAAAVAALRLFVQVYGAHAGNVALAYLATGGVYIAGGIAPKVLPAFRSGDFVRAFLDKGRMGALLAKMPVQIITNERVGLLGAARAASRLASSHPRS